MNAPIANCHPAEFVSELACAESDVQASARDWAVREADLERRLLQLSARIGRREQASIHADAAPIRRDAVQLYSSRWCHLARNSVALAK